MTAIQILLVIALTHLFIAGHWNNAESCLSPKLYRSTERPFIPSSVAKQKFSGRRVLYYSNADSSFSIQLVQCGDVESNPGPPLQQTDSSHVTYKAALENVSHHQEWRITYDRESLLSFKDVRNRITLPAWTVINELGISSKRRTKRGSKGGKKRHIKDVYNVTSENRTLARYALWNARSLNAKIPMVCEFVTTNEVDILAITETWLSGDSRDDRTIGDLLNSLPNYSFYHSPRIGRTGGGVGVCLKKGYTVHKFDMKSFSSFEYIDLLIHDQFGTSLRLATIYRPQRTDTGRSSVQLFFDEFSLFLEQMMIHPSKLMIAGDFNFHVNNPIDHDAGRFLELINSVNLLQHVSLPTHQSGHTLDLLLTRATECFVLDPDVQSYLPSDHGAVLCSLDIRKPKQLKVHVKYRKINNIDLDAFRGDILHSELFKSTPEETDELVQLYDSVLRNLLDKHAPLMMRSFFPRPHSPWYKHDLHVKKQELRRLEHKWRSTKLEVHLQIFKAACCSYKKTLTAARRKYHQTQFENCNTREIFQKFQKMFQPVSSLPLPKEDCDNKPEALPERFQNFFVEKVKKIVSEMVSNSNDPTSTYTLEERNCHVSFEIFRPLSVTEVKCLISKSSSASCDLDPIPTSLVKKSVHELAPIIQCIINKSFQTGIFPDSLKDAIVHPLIKDCKLDPDILKNYRPITNLKFIGKTVERAAVSQIQQYICDNNIQSSIQSAYRPFHSCETAVLRVSNDIYVSLDTGDEVILILLDFSSAFDTLKHDVLLHRLKGRFGIKGLAYQWFETYLKNRQQKVVVNGVESSIHTPGIGVPQGSVVGPILFTMYSSPLEDIIKAHNMSGMCYADDTQIYLRFKPGDLQKAIQKVECCIKHIKQWCTLNNLKLNDEKTEVLHITSRFRSRLQLPTINVDNSSIVPSDKVRNLGVIFDKHMVMDRFVSLKCKSACFQLHRIGKIRQYLDNTTTKKLVQALVLCHLDYCNSLLYNMPDSQLRRLQIIQNSAARLITGTKKFSPITPVLEQLHWLPVKSRISFKILLLTFQCLHNMAPSYLQELLKKYTPARNLRSSQKNLLECPVLGTRFYGERAFSFGGPLLWNAVPLDLKGANSVIQFKSLLKTFLFNEYYRN